MCGSQPEATRRTMPSMGDAKDGERPPSRDIPERKTARRDGGPLRLVLVRWRDAWFDIDQPGRWRSEYPVQTVGFLLREGPEVVSVAQELLPYGEGFRAVTHIPVGAVESITTLFHEEGPARREGDRALGRDA